MSFDGEDVQERENLLEDEVGADATSSSESDDDDAEKPRKSKVSIEKLLKTAFQEIADGKRNLTRSDDLAAFRSRDVHDLASDSGTKGAQTALHMLLDERGPDFPKVDDDQMKALITALVQHSNNLLAKGDREGKTPLYLAIDNKREKELEWLVEAHPKINTILQKSSNKQQYLHMAIKKKLKYFRQLVRKADDKTLALRDAKGNTILHLAVEWKRCRKDQLSVIEEIVAKSDKAVQEANGDFNRAGKSPYLHHRKTVREAKELAAAELRKQSENPPGRGRGEDFKNAAEPASTSNKTAARPVSPTRTPIVGVQVPRGFDMGPQPGLDASAKPRPAVLSNSRAKYVGGTVKAGDRVATLTDGDADGGRTPVVAESKSKFLPVSNSNSSKVLETVVEAVERFLKLHYLRSRSDAACMDILYGKEVVSDRELSFDLSGRSNMTQRGFRSLIKQLHFEDALQYVAIPTIRIEDNTGDKSNSSGSRRAGRDQSYKDGSGRDDLVQVFTTLRQKGVRTIIRAMVDDSFTPPHTDEAIEEALRGMDVEIWDWKKTDLSTEVIYTAAPRVREVHLYWSGNNTVLRGWSEEGGLKRLTELNSIHLHPQQGIESFRRTQQYVKDFTERIKRLGFKHDVQLFVDEGLGFRRQSLGDGSAGERSGVGIRGAKDELTSKHTWIDCMKRFRGLLLNAEASLDFQQVSQAIEENITVALIDDGVDGMDWDYPLLGGRTFYTRNEAEHLNHPYYASATGHGTAMAKLINFMCPRAKLYVLRLEDHPSEGGVRQITARSAAKVRTPFVLVYWCFLLTPTRPSPQPSRKACTSYPCRGPLSHPRMRACGES